MVKTSRIYNFTLVELLVVIAVISILTSMLLPAIHKARAKTISAVCASNQKQLGIAFMSYTGDNSERLPAPSSGSYTWDDLLAPHDGRDIPAGWDYEGGNGDLGSWGGTFKHEELPNLNKIYQCPVDPTNDGTRTNRSYAVNAGYPGNWWGVRGPIMSGWWITNGGGNDPWSMNLDTISEPSTAILMGEMVFDDNTQSLVGHNSNNSQGNWKGQLDKNPIKHGRELSLNYLFNDMHVSFNSIHDLNGSSGKHLWGGVTDVRGTWLDCRD